MNRTHALCAERSVRTSAMRTPSTECWIRSDKRSRYTRSEVDNEGTEGSAESGSSGTKISVTRRTDDDVREAGMLGASRHNGTWTRNFLAMRVVPALACDFIPDFEIHDAASLVRRGAHFGALAIATGCL